MSWPAEWRNRIKITIDHTKIDEQLLDFPVLVKLDTTVSGVFTETGDDYTKIQSASIDNTFLYTEVESWSALTSTANLWVKLPLIRTDTTTDFYLYYDNTATSEYTTATSDKYNGRVWSNGYETVLNMNQDPSPWPFNNAYLYTSEKSGTATVGNAAIAATSFTAVNKTGLTKENGALSVDLKVNDPAHCDWFGAGSLFEVTSGGTYDNQEWSYNLAEDPADIRDNITTEWTRFTIPLSHFVDYSGGLDVTNINYIRWFCYVKTGPLTIYWKNANIIYWPDAMGDSTENKKTIAVDGTMTTSDLIEGTYTKGITFDGTDDELTLESVIFEADKTLSFVLSFDKTNTQMIYSGASTGDRLSFHNTGMNLQYTSDVADTFVFSHTANITSTHKYDFVRETLDTIDLYIDGIFVQSVTEAGSSGVTLYNLFGKDITTTWEHFQGSAEQVILAETRSAGWLKAEYASYTDTLLSLGSIESKESFETTYSNKITLVIPEQPSTLNNLPVLIKLGPSSGVNNLRTTRIFNELSSPILARKMALVDPSGLEGYMDIYSWSNSNQTALIWAKIPELSNASQTILTLYYDKTANNNAQVGFKGSTASYKVWEDYSMVFHMDLDENYLLIDSTENAHHATTTDMASRITEGVVGGAVYLGGDAQGIVNNPTSLFNHKDFTLSYWTYPIDQGKTNTRLLHYGEGTANVGGFIYGQNSDGAQRTLVYGSSWITYATASLPEDGLFHQRTFVYDNTTYMNYTYTDGVLDGNGVSGDYKNAFNDAYLYIGKPGFNDTEDHEGHVDELRIHKIKRSGDFLAAEHKAYIDELIYYTVEGTGEGWLETYEGGELSPWAKRKKITIDSTNVDGLLVDFPVLINLTDSAGITNKDVTDIYTTVSGSSKKIAITAGDGTTQLPVEIEAWKATEFGIPFYPPEQSLTYVIATTYLSVTYVPYKATDPTLSLTGSDSYQWLTAGGATTNQKFNMDLGESFVATQIYFENGHNSGSSTARGTKNFIFYGTNESTAFLNTTYADLDDLTELGSFQAAQHVASNVEDPQYFDLSSNTLSFRYYILRIADNWGDGIYLQIRHIEVQGDVTYNNSQLWTKVPQIRSYEDTELYLYYDNTKSDNTEYVGETNSAAARNVWDDNFKLVVHLNSVGTNSTVSIFDSTQYSKHGTPFNIDDTNLNDGVVSNSVYLGDTDEYISFPADTYAFDGASFTLEAFQKSVTDSNCHLTKWTTSQPRQALHFGHRGSNNKKTLAFFSNDVDSTSSYIDDTWHYVAATYDTSVNLQKIYVDDSLSNSYTTSDDLTNTNSTELKLNFATTYGEGTWDEVRISDIIRSDTWLALTNYTCLDNLVTFGEEEEYTAPVIPEVPMYYYHGTITEDGLPVARSVYLYDRDLGNLVDSTISEAGTGYYLLETSNNIEHFVVVMDDEAGENYNPIIQDKLLPNGK